MQQCNHQEAKHWLATEGSSIDLLGPMWGMPLCKDASNAGPFISHHQTLPHWPHVQATWRHHSKRHWESWEILITASRRSDSIPQNLKMIGKMGSNAIGPYPSICWRNWIINTAIFPSVPLDGSAVSYPVHFLSPQTIFFRIYSDERAARYISNQVHSSFLIDWLIDGFYWFDWFSAQFHTESRRFISNLVQRRIDWSDQVESSRRQGSEKSTRDGWMQWIMEMATLLLLLLYVKRLPRFTFGMTAGICYSMPVVLICFYIWKGQVSSVDWLFGALIDEFSSVSVSCTCWRWIGAVSIGSQRRWLALTPLTIVRTRQQSSTTILNNQSSIIMLDSIHCSSRADLPGLSAILPLGMSK